jgi:hypothetical protein
MIAHPAFVADHVALARPGHFSQGVRILLDEAATRRLLDPLGRLPGLFSPGLGFARRAYALHAPRIARVVRRAANRVIAVKACNQGFWRDDLVAVNGFDEAMTGWGAEDKELCARLENAGVEMPADSPTEVPEGSVRVTFLVEVRSADDARCPAVSVEAAVAGPERSRTVVGTTDLMGRVRFRMTGPAGDYSCEITDVAAGGLDWNRDAGPVRLAVECR